MKFHELFADLPPLAEPVQARVAPTRGIRAGIQRALRFCAGLTAQPLRMTKPDVAQRKKQERTNHEEWQALRQCPASHPKHESEQYLAVCVCYEHDPRTSPAPNCVNVVRLAPYDSKRREVSL